MTRGEAIAALRLVRDEYLAHVIERCGPEDVEMNLSVADVYASASMRGLADSIWDEGSFRFGTASDVFDTPFDDNERTFAWGATLNGVPCGNWIYITDSPLDDELVKEIRSLQQQQADETLFALIQELPEWTQ